MRKTVALVALAAVVGGCSMFKRTFGTNAYHYGEPGTTAIYGTWVLRSPDSTSFVGANEVQLTLEPGTFRVAAAYPGRSPLIVSGTAHVTDTGVLMLTPTSTVNEPIQGRSLNFVAGTPIALVASAAGNTLVFAPANREIDPTPSSVWHRLQAAEKAGLTTAQSDSARKPDRR